MDDSWHRENGRHKPPQGQWFMQHQPSLKQIMAMMAERDAALQERNLAISQRKAAMAERDLAILQRDSVISERNSALNLRDNAIAALQYRENTMTNGVKHVHRPQQHLHHHHQLHMDEDPNSSRDMHISDGIPMSPVPLEPAKSRQTKRTKEAKATAPNRKPSKSLKSVKREEGEDIGLKPNWNGQDLGLNQVAFDNSTMPVPVCSCTGILRSCYKWGNGGWQSSCCTTTMSMYPLPAVPNKRHARVGGRKMSGSAYNKLISRLTAEGHDLSNPVDLKDNWAKHGTNRYITIK